MISFKVGNFFNISNSKNLKINACEITATGNYAISVSNCQDAVVSNCHIHDVGGGGMSVSGGSRTKLTPGNTLIENCLIERFMEYRKTYMAGVSLSGVGHRISHCEFSDAPHEAITYSGNNHIIEYCNIYNVCNETADCGAIYTGRDWSTQGHQIRYNCFHDMKLIGTNTGMKNHAVYLDDTHSSTKVYGNVFYKASSVALYGGGRYNTFVNNLMLECDEPFYFDNRGMWWTNSWLKEDTGDSVYRKLKAYDYKNGVWAEQYPYLVNILEDEPKIPKHNVITGNVIYKTPSYNFAQEVYDYGTFENNITITDTGSFADYNGGDFNILPDSEIMKRIPDFNSADFNDMGRYSYTLNNRSPLPSVTNLSVSGKETLTLAYTYNGKGYAESAATAVTWYASDKTGSNYTKISTGKTISVTDELTGRYIKAVVTPVNCEGVIGANFSSIPVIAGRGTNADILKVTKDNGKTTVENQWSRPVALGIFRPSYKESDGVKTMTALNMSFVTLSPLEKTETDGITVTMDNLEPVR